MHITILTDNSYCHTEVSSKESIISIKVCGRTEVHTHNPSIAVHRGQIIYPTSLQLHYAAQHSVIVSSSQIIENYIAQTTMIV